MQDASGLNVPSALEAVMISVVHANFMACAFLKQNVHLLSTLTHHSCITYELRCPIAAAGPQGGYGPGGAQLVVFATNVDVIVSIFVTVNQTTRWSRIISMSRLAGGKPRGQPPCNA